MYTGSWLVRCNVNGVASFKIGPDNTGCKFWEMQTIKSCLPLYSWFTAHYFCVYWFSVLTNQPILKWWQTVWGVTIIVLLSPSPLTLYLLPNDIIVCLYYNRNTFLICVEFHNFFVFQISERNWYCQLFSRQRDLCTSHFAVKRRRGYSWSNKRTIQATIRKIRSTNCTGRSIMDVSMFWRIKFEKNSQYSK